MIFLIISCTVLLIGVCVVWKGGYGSEKAQVSDASAKPEKPCHGLALAVEYPYTGGVLPPKECDFQCNDAVNLYYILYTNIDPNTGKLYASQCGNPTIKGAEYTECSDYGEAHSITCIPNIAPDQPYVDVTWVTSSSAGIASSPQSSAAAPVAADTESSSGDLLAVNDLTDASSEQPLPSLSQSSPASSSVPSSSSARLILTQNPTPMAKVSSSQSRASVHASISPAASSRMLSIFSAAPRSPAISASSISPARQFSSASSITPVLISPPAAASLPQSSAAASASAFFSLHGVAASDSVGGTFKIVQNPPSNLLGNGHLDPGETCDDGNQVNGDGCSADGQLESGIVARCGDGILEAGEQCDDGRRNGLPPSTCNMLCKNVQAPVVANAVQPLEVRATLVTTATSHAPQGKTGPEVLLIISSGAAAGWAWMWKKRRF